MNVELNDTQTEVPVRELSRVIEYDRYPSVPDIVKEILAKFRPEPERVPLTPRRHHESPSRGRHKRGR